MLNPVSAGYVNAARRLVRLAVRRRDGEAARRLRADTDPAKQKEIAERIGSAISSHRHDPGRAVRQPIAYRKERHRHPGAGPAFWNIEEVTRLCSRGGGTRGPPASLRGSILMYGYIFRRLLGDRPVMLMVAVFVFLMLRLTPGDPAAIIAGDNATTEQVAQIREQLGLDRPMIEQFFIWSGKVLRGDFGEIVLLQEDGGRADRRADRADPVARLFTILIAGRGRGAARRAGGAQAGLVDRPHRDGLLGARLSVPVFVIGYLADLPVRGLSELAAGAGLSAHRGRGWRLPAAADPAVGDLLGDLHRADRAHDAHQRARSAGSEDYIRTARAKGQPSARCCSVTRCAMRRCRSSP